jgi:hypothetical protein
MRELRVFFHRSVGAQKPTGCSDPKPAQVVDKQRLDSSGGHTILRPKPCE